MTDSLRIIVVDDETIIAEYLSTFLKKQGHEVELLYSADIAFAELLNKFGPDLIFLDINLNSTLTGIDLAKICNEKGVPFIYLTSYSDQKTIESALAFDPVSYILKPFTEKDIQVNLEIAKVKIRKHQASTNTNGILVLKEGYDTIRVEISQIKWLKADNVYTEIITSDKKILQRASLQNVHQSLPQDAFLRVHRSYVINVHAVSRVASDYLELGEERIPLSRSKKAEVLKKLSL